LPTAAESALFSSKLSLAKARNLTLISARMEKESNYSDQGMCSLLYYSSELSRAEMDPEFIKTDPNYQLVKNCQTLIHKKGETLYAKIPNWKVKKFIPVKPMVISGMLLLFRF
jgi:hypothetical protein